MPLAARSAALAEPVFIIKLIPAAFLADFAPDLMNREEKRRGEQEAN